ncbi:MAG: argininosuccinate synthase [Anaerolineaceae bacterium]|nr:argininosuccinate synthase [Anaerolineaceae bacterium]
MAKSKKTETKSGQVKKVVLAYSGGLDTSVILPWLRENYGCEVICYAADLGQGVELEGVREKAKACGARRIVVEDLRKTFVEDYLWKMLKAGAVYENEYLLGTSIARPLIAARQVAAARKFGADALAHGATGKGNDQVRFELTYQALAPDLKVIAPWRDPRWTLTSREAAIDYAKAHNVPVRQTKKKIYSEDGNLWHLSHEGAELENPWNAPQDKVFTISNTVEKAPAKPAQVTIDFVKGRPVAVNGKKLGGVAIMDKLNALGGKHAVGQADLVENRLVGMKSRGVYETPGGSILYKAHQVLESICLEREMMHYKQQVALKYAELVYCGQWFHPLREALDAFIDKTQQCVTGTVRLKLYKGNIIPAGVRSPYSLYSEGLASFTMGAEYDPAASGGFIRCFGLPMKVHSMIQGAGSRKSKASREK